MFSLISWFMGLVGSIADIAPILLLILVNTKMVRSRGTAGIVIGWWLFKQVSIKEVHIFIPLPRRSLILTVPNEGVLMETRVVDTENVING